MKRRTFLFTLVFVAIGLIGVWFWRGRSQDATQEHTKKSVITPSKPLASASTPKNAPPPTPRFFKSKRYPPETAEEKAMWEWWNTMSKLDSNFEWKMPIEFFGRVVDQFGAPVAGATVDMQWSVVGGTDNRKMFSEADGTFSLSGVHGKGITVSISKEGYWYTRDSARSFEYAEFFDDRFHTPDKAHPVVFRLQKLMGAEPVFVFPVNGRTTPDGPALWLNVEKGKFEPTGDFSFGVSLGDRKTRMGQEYTIVVQAWDGAVFAPTSEEFPFLAPEDGYKDALTVHQVADDPNYQLRKNVKFYAKLPGGRYAFVGMDVTLVPGGDVLLSGGVRYNQKWSKNLEFDHRKWINR